MQNDEIVTFPVAATTVPSKLASAVVRTMQSGKTIQLTAVGAGPNYVVVQALFEMNKFLANEGFNEVVLDQPIWSEDMSCSKDRASEPSTPLTTVHHYLERVPKNVRN